MIDILDRVRNKGLQSKIVSAEEAAAFFKPGMNVAMSGFTSSAYPKAVPLALAERMKKDPFTINLWTGASVGPELDTALAEVHGIKTRLPYQTDKALRSEINDGSVNYLDLHLSESAQLARYGYLGKIDIAVVEACAIDEEGRRRAYIRIADENIVASPVHLVVWREQFSPQGSLMAFNENEKQLMKTMAKQPMQTLNQIVRRSHLARHKVITLLGRFIRYNLVAWHFTDRQFKFTLNE